MIGLDGRGKRCPDLGCDFGGRPAEFPEPVHAYDVARLRRSGGSTVWLAQIVAAMPSIAGAGW